MENLKVAFYIFPDGKSPPVHYCKASGNLIFDVRMTLEHKSIWVKDGHENPQPECSVFQVEYHTKAIKALYHIIH